MTIIMTRHGQTDWNREKKVMGRYDEPLNNKGISQAKETKELLNNIKIDLIICSPLKRAKQTAEIINKNRNIKVIYDDRLIERDFGEFEGTKTEEFNFQEFWDYYKNNIYEKAENIQEFFERVYNFLDDITKKYNDKTVLIVAHGGISMPVACYFNNSIPNGSLLDAGLLLNNCQVAKYVI